jgi:hypothetical protein
MKDATALSSIGAYIEPGMRAKPHDTAQFERWVGRGCDGAAAVEKESDRACRGAERVFKN